MKKRIYRAPVLQKLRDTGLHYQNVAVGVLLISSQIFVLLFEPRAASLKSQSDFLNTTELTNLKNRRLGDKKKEIRS